jgi:hypothetical protein
MIDIRELTLDRNRNMGSTESLSREIGRKVEQLRFELKALFP